MTQIVSFSEMEKDLSSTLSQGNFYRMVNLSVSSSFKERQCALASSGLRALGPIFRSSVYNSVSKLGIVVYTSIEFYRNNHQCIRSVPAHSKHSGEGYTAWVCY